MGTNAFSDFGAPQTPPDQPPAPNAFADLAAKAAAPPKPPVTAADRVQAGEAGFLKGAAYLATMPADAVANIYNLGKAGVGYGYSKLTGNAVPHALEASDASPVGGWLTRQMDKNSITSTQPNRPDDTASRYLATAGSVIPGVLTGGGGVGATAKGIATAIPPAMAGQAVAEAHPFKSDWANTLASVGAQIGTGLLMPRPGELKPENDIRNKAVTEGQEAGYVFPPATTNPSAGNRTIETIAGKISVQQHASLHNQEVTNALAREEIGLPQGGAISEDEISAAKNAAAPGYDNIRQAGTITPPPDFQKNLQASLAKNTGASRLSGRLGNSELEGIVSDLKGQSSFDASDAIDAIAMLRDKASSAYRAGDSNIGAAYRGVSKTIEDAIDQSLSSQGGQSADLLNQYRNSRQMFAKINTIEEARDANTGNVVAPKLAAAYGRGAPLSGNLLTAAKSAGQAPKAFAQPTSSAGVNHTGLWGGLGGLALGHELLPEHMGAMGIAAAAAVPAARYGARLWALGPGQGNALPTNRTPLTTAQILSQYPSLVDKKP